MENCIPLIATLDAIILTCRVFVRCRCGRCCSVSSNNFTVICESSHVRQKQEYFERCIILSSYKFRFSYFSCYQPVWVNYKDIVLCIEIVGVIWRKPVPTQASSVFTAGIGELNSVKLIWRIGTPFILPKILDWVTLRLYG